MPVRGYVVRARKTPGCVRRGKNISYLLRQFVTYANRCRWQFTFVQTQPSFGELVQKFSIVLEIVWNTQNDIYES